MNWLGYDFLNIPEFIRTTFSVIYGEHILGFFGGSEQNLGKGSPLPLTSAFHIPRLNHHGSFEFGPRNWSVLWVAITRRLISDIAGKSRLHAWVIDLALGAPQKPSFCLTRGPLLPLEEACFVWRKICSTISPLEHDSMLSAGGLRVWAVTINRLGWLLSWVCWEGVREGERDG